MQDHVEVRILFHNVDLILLDYSNFAKKYVVIFITCYVIDFIFHEYYSNILWVLNIDMNIDICKKPKQKLIIVKLKK